MKKRLKVNAKLPTLDQVVVAIGEVRILNVTHQAVEVAGYFGGFRDFMWIPKSEIVQIAGDEPLVLRRGTASKMFITGTFARFKGLL